MHRIAILLSLIAYPAISPALEPDSAPERGKKALLGKNYVPPTWRQKGYDRVWRQWGLNTKPAEFETALRERYGLHEAPYPNNGLPMGLRKAPFILGSGVAVDCLLCHGGSIMGKSYIGLGNTSLDIQALFEEMIASDGLTSPRLPFTFSNMRGTSEAGTMAVFLLSYRNPDLSLRHKPKNFELKDDMCEDVPAWWLLKKKQTMYYTGGADARSVRSKMQFMMSPITMPSEFHKHEAAFHDIQEYLLTLEAPKYPLPINQELAAKGLELFTRNCAKCHGTYGEKPTYPNKIITLKEIGTDPKRFEGISEEFGEYYNQSWFAQEKRGWFVDGYPALQSKGYQAPPLDGIWATAPYLHNGSVPTVYQVLKSDSRPKRYTRSYRTDLTAYDSEKLGWKYEEVKNASDDKLPPIERRKIYDTNQPGRGNSGHTFGDDLTEPERMAVIEYLKTL